MRVFTRQPPEHGVDAAAVDAKGTDTSPAQPVTTADLAAAGLAVFAEPGASSPIVAVTTTLDPTPLRLLKDQADAMLQEAAAGQGTRGSDSTSCW